MDKKHLKIIEVVTRVTERDFDVKEGDIIFKVTETGKSVREIKLIHYLNLRTMNIMKFGPFHNQECQFRSICVRKV